MVVDYTKDAEQKSKLEKKLQKELFPDEKVLWKHILKPNNSNHDREFYILGMRIIGGTLFIGISAALEMNILTLSVLFIVVSTLIVMFYLDRASYMYVVTNKRGLIVTPFMATKFTISEMKNRFKDVNDNNEINLVFKKSPFGKKDSYSYGGFYNMENTDEVEKTIDEL